MCGYPGDAVLSRVLLLQPVLLQRLHHRKVSCVSRGEQDGLIGDVGLQTVRVDPQGASCRTTQTHILNMFRAEKKTSADGQKCKCTALHQIVQTIQKIQVPPPKINLYFQMWTTGQTEVAPQTVLGGLGAVDQTIVKHSRGAHDVSKLQTHSFAQVL